MKRRLTACLLLPMLAAVGTCSELAPHEHTLDDWTTSELAREVFDRETGDVVDEVEDWLDGLFGDDD